MKKTAFDKNKYLKIQRENILKRIDKFGDKLYLEFGGKLFDDYHASRVLPGFEPDTKLQMLLGIKVIKIQSGSMKTSMLTTANYDFEKMADKSIYFSKPMRKLKHLMDNELTKTNNPQLVGDLVVKILNKKNPRIRYKIKNSFKLAIMGALPEGLQDKIYTKVIK